MSEVGLTVLREADQAFALTPDRWALVRRAVTDTLAAHHAKSPQSPGLETARLRPTSGSGTAFAR